ncbi:hypothetical protein CDAR_257751 [Caerostris darwini]|uniref:Uncharacterized protein n=1 Tax=Caerostris darwini TaxID=1538125 RepID=A0AAV4WWC8_9ARAC|nr:hypothetical protein CDAR_257751 [Caerostris darwini]
MYAEDNYNTFESRNVLPLSWRRKSELPDPKYSWECSLRIAVVKYWSMIATSLDSALICAHCVYARLNLLCKQFGGKRECDVVSGEGKMSKRSAVSLAGHSLTKVDFPSMILEINFSRKSD